MSGKKNQRNSSTNPGTLNRRSVLRTTGGIAGAGIVGAGLAGASKSGQQEYVGVSYDTLTHQAQDQATAQIQAVNDGLALRGELHFGGFQIPFGQDEPLQPRMRNDVAPLYELEKTGSKFNKDGLPLRVQFEKHRDHIVGYTTRPDGDHSKLSFTIGDPNEGYSPSFVESALFGNGKGLQLRDFDDVPRVPTKGIPTNTSLRNITAQIRERRGDLG